MITFLFVLLLLAGASEAGAQDTARTPAVDRGVMLLTLPDVSGTMHKTVGSLAAAEIAQLRRSLRPGDFYARLPFTGVARTAILQRVHDTSDIDLIAKVIAENASATGARTALSAGLVAGRDVVARHGKNRHVVLVMTTDGISDPVDAALERRAFEDAARWWRSRPNTTRIVVGPDNNAAANASIKSLAKALDARIVTPDAFARESVIERAVVQARPTAMPNQPKTVSGPRRNSALWWVPLIALVVVGAAILRRRLRRRAGAPPAAGAPLLLPVAPAVKHELSVKVTGQGRTNDQVLDADSLPEGGLTFGLAGSIPVSGLPGSPIAVEIIGDELVVAVEPGHGVRIDGEPADAIPQPMHVGRVCTLTVRGSAIALQMRRVGEGATVAPLRIAGIRRRA